MTRSRLLAAFLAVFTLLFLAVPSAQAATAATPTLTRAKTVCVYGDSIGAGGWLTQNGQKTSDGWVQQLERAAATQGIRIINLSVGGMALHSPSGTNRTFLPWIKTTIANGQCPRGSVIIMAAGTNDMLIHSDSAAAYDATNLFYSKYAATQVQAYLLSQGMKRIIWNQVYPFAMHMPDGRGWGYVYPGWVPLLASRVNNFNGWLSAAYGANVLKTNWVLQDWSCWCKGDARYFIDGVHPNAAGHARIAWAFDWNLLNY